MNTKLFTTVIVAVIAICLILTMAHVVYAINAYEHCSIIAFIAKELW